MSKDVFEIVRIDNRDDFQKVVVIKDHLGHCHEYVGPQAKVFNFMGVGDKIVWIRGNQPELLQRRTVDIEL